MLFQLPLTHDCTGELKKTNLYPLPAKWLACSATNHSAYVVTLTKSHGVKMNGFLHPNFMYIPKIWGVKDDFSLLKSESGGTFHLHFRNLHKIWISESIDLTSIGFGLRCNIGWVISEYLLSALLNWFKLVYWPFALSNMHYIVQSERNQMYQGKGMSYCFIYILCAHSFCYCFVFFVRTIYNMYT